MTTRALTPLSSYAAILARVAELRNEIIATCTASVSCSSVGLIEIDDGSHQVGMDALHSASNSKQHQNLLYAIGGARTSSQPLFEAAQSYLGDEDKDVQIAAIGAVTASAVDKYRASSALEAPLIQRARQR